MATIDRRRVLIVSGLGGLGLLACEGKGARDAHDEKREEEEVSPAEDLMREHGALNRLLLVYEECARRIDENAPVPRELGDAAELIRRFVEDYHEKLEEDFLFPRFEKAGKLVDLVATLRKQHAAGRRATADILGLARAREEGTKKALAAAIRSFVRMYRPHEAREDTVLFPALPSVIGEKELDALGERFEEKEHALFGKAGFEGIVEEIAKLERTLGIFELDQFTPA